MGIKIPLILGALATSFIASVTIISLTYDDSMYYMSAFSSSYKNTVLIESTAPRSRTKAPTEEEYQKNFAAAGYGDVNAVPEFAEINIEDLAQKRTGFYDGYNMFPTYNKRYQAHIQTDKIVYRPNDVMFIEVFVFDAFTKKPIVDKEWTATNIGFEILDSTDSQVHSDSTNKMSESTFAYTYKVPQEASGGEYQIRLSGYSVPCANKIVRVRDYDRQNLVITTEWDRDTYFPGDLVTGTVVVQPSDGNAFSKSPTVDYNIDFGDYAIPVSEKDKKVSTETNSLRISFKVPETTDVQHATMGLKVTAGKTTQTSSKVLVIGQPAKLFLEFFPESNFITDSVKNKVYFQAWASDKKTDIVDFGNAHLINQAGETVGEDIGTFHRGKGMFYLRPKKGETYFLDINLGGSKGRVQREIPRVEEWMRSTVGFQLGKNIVDNKESLSVIFNANEQHDESKTYQFAIQQKEKQMYQQELKFKKGSVTKITVSAKDFNLVNGGVLNAVLSSLDYYIYETEEQNDIDEGVKPEPRGDEEEWDGDNARFAEPDWSGTKGGNGASDIQRYYEPQGEILFFKKPANNLSFDIKTDSDSYAPGDEVKYTVSVKENGKSVSSGAFVSVTATDESVYAQLSKRQQPPNLAAMVHLEHEIEKTNFEWDYASNYINHLYGVDADESADTNLELLLGVQKWRYCFFCPVTLEKNKDLLYEIQDDEEKERLMSLMAVGDTSKNNNNNWEMMAEEDGDIFFDAVMPEMAMMKRGGAVDKAAQAGPAANTVTTTSTSPKKEKSGSEVEALDEDAPKRDFMTGIETNTRWFSHERREDWSADERVDMTETVFFSAAKEVKSGKITGSFFLSDLITEFRISASGFDKDGALGYNWKNFQAAKPFYINFELPSNFLVGDILEIPVSINNFYSKDQDVKISALYNEDMFQISNTDGKVKAPKKSRISHYLTVKALASAKDAYVIVTAETEQGHSDKVTQFASVRNIGFPTEKSAGGFLSSQRKQKKIPDNGSLEFLLPKTYVENSLDVEAKIISSSFATLTEAIEALVRDPYGCFEQTSSSTYPVVMAHNFMAAMPESEAVNDLKGRLEEKMQKGYDRLITFETEDEGYEWFGTTPPHESLSAYGLMEFTDMAENSNIVDTAMLDRLKTWLLSKRDGKGSFKLSDKALDSFGRAPQVTSDAYILWSLTASGITTGLDKEINALKTQVAGNSKTDPYVIGLLSIVLSNVGEKAEALKYAKQLPSFAKVEEELMVIQGAKTSITSSSGTYLDLETTSISILAWMPFQSEFSEELEQSIKMLVASVKKGGRYGSTQATVLAIKAITSYMKNYVSLNGKGKFVLYANDKPLAEASFSNKEREALKFGDVSKELKKLGFKPNDQVTLRIQLENFKASDSSEKDFKVQYALSAVYNDQIPPSTNVDLQFSVDMSTSGTIGKGSEGKIFKYKAKLQNLNTEEGTGMAVAILRVPSCLAMNWDLVEKMRDNGDFDMYEVRNNNSELVLYWTGMGPKYSKSLTFEFQQAYKGDVCQQQVHTAYLYYVEHEIIICGVGA